MRPGIESKALFPSTDGKRMPRTVAMHVVSVERIAGTISQLSCTEQRCHGLSDTPFRLASWPN